MALATTYDRLDLCSSPDCWNGFDVDQCEKCESNFCDECTNNGEGLEECEIESFIVMLCSSCAGSS